MTKPEIPSAILDFCRSLRKDQTDAEGLLWVVLRNRQLNGAKFRRQHPLGRYILDFYCHEIKLAIELDGGGHAEDSQFELDQLRSAFLATQGIRVLRFWNNEVAQDLEGVISVIWDAIEEGRRPSP